MGDKAYDADWIRAQIKEQGAVPNVHDLGRCTMFSRTVRKPPSIGPMQQVPTCPW
jgi:hypothetical protein